jgi:hypothetical protein
VIICKMGLLGWMVDVVDVVMNVNINMILRQEDVVFVIMNVLICGWMEDVIFVEKNVNIVITYRYGQMEYA